MGRNRVLSFMSHFSGSTTPPNSEPKPLYDESPPTSSSPTPTPAATNNGHRFSILGAKQDSPHPNGNPSASKVDFLPFRGHSRAVSSPVNSVASSSFRVDHDSSPLTNSPITVADHSRSRSRSASRPLSMVQVYQPPRMDVNEDTIPELQPIFTFLNSHGNKLYQEGYFLKLDDQNTQGKPNPDRTWTECFAQLVGTVLSLWDAAELDAAGENGEVLPKFINLTDASIKMIESLPTRSQAEQPLQNILSISTAGRNRYLLHFNSRHSLTQWTAGIRLAMFEHSTLQEAYTGALIAGKGKTLNNIGIIMERSRMPVEQWVRVRFGAGVPWRRCWCAIQPPDEKEYQKVMKEHKKKNPYDRSHPPTLKGSIKFYDQRKEGKKQKKVQPIATINDAYSAYALYPQAKSLIDASTLIKIEGDITIHADPPSSTEGFVFIMPEVNPAISGFEMMLRFLFPTWDTFGLYGRPGRLVASVLDSRSLMFAMPKSKRYGYLELLDVTSLILTDGSGGWNEREWRKKMKELTGTRMNTADAEPESNDTSRTNSRTKRLSFGTGTAGASKPRVGFADDALSPPSGRASRSLSLNAGSGGRNESAPPANRIHSPPMDGYRVGHARNTSDPDLGGPVPPQVPTHGSPFSISPQPGRGPNHARAFVNDLAATPERVSSEDERLDMPPMHEFEGMRRMQTPEPVPQPTFNHAPGAKPNNRPYHSPEMRRANSRLSMDTLNQLKAGGVVPTQDNWNSESEQNSELRRDPSPANLDIMNNGFPVETRPLDISVANAPRSPGLPPFGNDLAPQRSRSPANPAMGGPPDGLRPSPRPTTPSSRPGTAPGSRPPVPPVHGQPQGNFRPGYNGPPPPGPPGMGPQGGGRGGRGGPNMAHPNRGRGRGGYPPGPAGRGRGGPLPALNTAPVQRKPLPARSDSLQQRAGRGEATPPAESASSGSFTGRIDAEGFGQVRAHNVTIHPGIQRYNTTTTEGSRYDDADSVSSPDYASSRPSTETAASFERPRAGVLRTVGAPESSETQASRNDAALPTIDFGHTLNYAVAPRSMAPAVEPVQPPRSFSPALRGQSPVPPIHKQPVQGSDDNARRSMIWQPAAAAQRTPSPGGPGLSAEEFVQQRAAAASATPLYAHQRQSSSVTLSGYRGGTPTPPPGRVQGSDYIGIAHSRNNSQELLQRPGSRGPGDIIRPRSRELLQRPGSRGAGAVLGGDSHLSAREQEHVARVTGTPLINMAGNTNTRPAGDGLVAALEAREREREQIKHGWGGAAVQNAIYQRQQMQQQQAMHQQYQQPLPSPGMPPPSGMYSQMGRGMGVPQSPGSQGFGMASPGMPTGMDQNGYRSPPTGNTDPRFMAPQGQGQNAYQYHGQAF
ncbi:hypothetical protein F5Y16DRAFT_369418 [Xylariaceae sp. FL0255]|nr:hypothetical protein F5Y16DRAFT_369418 [Xylariaceae sp. FL0255]